MLLGSPMNHLSRVCLSFIIATAGSPWLIELPFRAWLFVTVLSALSWVIHRRAAELALAFSLGTLGVATLPEGPVLDGIVCIQGVVVGPQTVSLSRRASPGERWTETAGRVYVQLPGTSPPPGTAIVAYGVAESVERRAVLPGAPDPVRAAQRARIRSRIRVSAIAQLGSPPQPRTVDAVHASIIAALGSGRRSEVPPEVAQLLRRTGTSHVLAISGLHVGLVALVTGWCGRFLLRSLSLLRAEGMPGGLAWIFGALCGVAYAWTAGAPVSAQRAGAMILLIAVGRCFGRVANPMALLGVAGVGVLLIDPSAIGGASFQLSFGALLGLIGLAPRLARGWRDPLSRAVAATVAATLGTLPAAAWWFQELSWVSPVANLVAVPLVSIIVVPCSVVASWGPDATVSAATWLADHGIALLLAILRTLSAAPLNVAIPAWGSVVSLSVLLIRPRVHLFLAVFLLAMGLRQVSTQPQVTFLDVGQGDAALIALTNGDRWLIDGGPPGRSVSDWLLRRGVRRLAVVVASHGHPDHTGGLGSVLERLQVGELWISSTEGVAELLEIAARRRILVRLIPPEALHPAPDFRGDNLNDRSLVVLAEGVFFGGDIEQAAEAAVLRKAGRVRILKVAHHGSRTSSTPTLLHQLDPELAIVSAGRRNGYGHPHLEVLDRFDMLGVPVLRTDQLGTIELTLDATLEARSWRAGRGWRRVRLEHAEFAGLSPEIPKTLQSQPQ